MTEMFNDGAELSGHHYTLTDTTLNADHIKQFTSFVEALGIDTSNASDYVNATAMHLPLFVNAGNGNDTVYGGSGADFIHGMSGNDFIVPGRGRDTVYGEGGDDVIIAGDGLGVDSIDAGDGSFDIIRCDSGDTFAHGEQTVITGT